MWNLKKVVPLSLKIREYMITKIIHEEKIQKAKKYVEKGESFVIVTHVTPDGDAIGSALGLYHFLTAYGKDNVTVVVPNDFPQFYKWMPGHKEIVIHEKYPVRRLGEALKIDYSVLGREWAYHGIKPCIVAEELLTDESGDDLKDYKVFCFNGEPKFIQIDYDRFKGHKRRLYTTDWNLMETKITYPDDADLIMPKPIFLDELLKISKKLSKDIPFLRVDCYITEKQIYFGELTFYPGCGFEPITPDTDDALWGEWLKLPEETKK